MKARFIPLLCSLCFSVGLENKSSILMPHQTKLCDYEVNPLEEYDILYEEEDYEYDGFLDELFLESDLIEKDDIVHFQGITSDEYEEYSCVLELNMETLDFYSDFSESGLNITCDNAIVDEHGRLDAEIHVENPDTCMDEIYRVSDYRDMNALHEFVKNPESDMERESGISTYGWINFLFRKLMTPAVALYVIISETAEQIKARSNYDYNKNLEACGEGMGTGNYITNQMETQKNGYRCGDYRLGFATFSKTGCEVASVYNLMIDRKKEQSLSQVIFDFEKWSIEFSVGWGFLGSNPQEIYRYLKNYDIRYYINYLPEYFKARVNDSGPDTQFIMSAFNKEGLQIHTYFFKNTNDGILLYNFKSRETTTLLKTMDDLYAQVGTFVVGYKIYD